MVMNQIFQVSGSLLILVGFILVQLGLVDTQSRFYLALNAVGSAVLAENALTGHQWGFLLLEGVWAAVSLVGMLRIRISGQAGRRIRPGSRHPAEPSARGGAARRGNGGV
jgi:hypothetical protein